MRRGYWILLLLLSGSVLMGQTTIQSVSSIYIKAYLGEAELSQGLWEGERYHGELLSFDAVEHEKGVEVIWTTAIEVGSKYFALERKQFDGSFAIIEIVEAKGMSEKLTPYSIVDIHPRPGVNVYRIRQINQDGEINIGPVREFNSSDSPWITFAPKISEDQIDLAGHGDLMMVQVIDKQGNVILTQDRSGAWSDVWDISKLKPGQYALRLKGSNGDRVMRFRKK